MFKQLKELYSLLTEDQRKKLRRLQFLVVLMAFAELGSVLSIGPFMALVGDMSQLQSDGIVGDIYRMSGLEDPRTFLFWTGIGVLVALTVAALISMFTIWRLSMYGARVGAELSSRLYRHYMHQPWLFHASGSSSQLTNQIAQECGRVTGQIINPLMQMNARIVMAALMAVAIFIFNPAVAITGLVIFVVAYMAMYRIVRQRLIRNGGTITSAQRMRFKLMGEGFGGIKDALLLGRQQVFTDRFDQASIRFADAQGKNQVMSQVPRFVMELVAFGSVIFLILYLLAAHDGNLGTILPLLSVYALAGFKLLPAFQQIYSSISGIRGSLTAFEGLRDDLRASATATLKLAPSENSGEHLTPRKSIELKNVQFTYPGKAEPALRDLTINIGVNQVIGLVGASGSGKSTAIDILLGLIQPESGELLIDGEPITKQRLRAWQNSLGFVPQSIFLADSSIRENIAFGLPPELVDDEKVQRAATMAHLDELLAELPDGLNTRVGERGVQLSGGQRQRIGIARALYHDADVLILDEATSALDGITEKLIMDAIHDFSGKKTIIMIAHRLATVKKCDSIYLLANGRVRDRGTYSELCQRNDVFKRMADHA
ncbi:ABC transporter ATP-binding protein [Marinobacter shengliensis]|uniref:ABC transporter ATP-binding protein n=1 Tax=Marinobacter shengliensis TaxID=1389223 RepID=UPI001E5ADD0C|nr:ABC transporter ATP-binding protein [Marinobacter shengliensis]MCD1630738.1 ABC transporter ATP-binding protein/permease [Marinobacter shengliensis]